MLEWFGGPLNVIEILIPLVGICVLLIAPKITDTGRSRRYFVPAFTCWFGFHVLIGLEEGTLVSFPYLIRLISAILLLLGFVGYLFRGLFAAWKEQESNVSSV
ncbi:hypothetical protein HALLA_18665 [Halostagnicola larsenii XH-48]|uniref:Uncharacterized protein n=1 Tax=Halostagnicola larsenii XH-48 TaxID=797299 RepID=W0JRC8_9EURY|nr:hypothetical protein HALLA_18665 [Halostagnicola larsenii XH-48]